MLDWNALIPSAAIDARSESAPEGQKTGDIPGIRGARSSYPGIDKHSDTKGSRNQSPESPVSPVQKHRTAIESSERGVGGEKPNCARETIFLALGDLRTCELCGNLTEAGRCDAAARREIVASRNYQPIRDMPKRCEAYMPPVDDPDQRPGAERWPGLTW
ncbi:MAG: hypothetical protein Q8M11_11705 [Sulfuritalea sp.]|nr:hypothetical protein [Sulfuritalea sp.]MDP1981756.1 hypothetical protein [Sulfuritalea sp.]